MKKVVLVAVVAVVLVAVGYGQYQPEHLWHRSGEEYQDWFGKYIASVGDINNEKIKNCNNHYQNWNLITQEYNCFTLNPQ